MAGAGDEWLSPGRFALVLGALVFVSFPQVVLGFEAFVFRDFGRFGFPLAYFQRECFWQGQLPFWNPYNNCGVPFFAQWNTMPLYPPALVYLLLPLGWSLSFFCLVHLFFAGVGMYALAYRWTNSRLGASVAGLVFAFNGLSLNSLMWPSQIATFAWMPWVVLAVERGWQEGGTKLVWAGLVGALQMLCGGPETILFTWILVAGLWVFSPQEQNQAPGFRKGLRFGSIVLIVFGLSAAQLLPFLDFARHSQRGQHFLDLRWPLPSRGWANFLVPMAFASPGETGVWFQHEQFWTSSYYLGVGTVLLGLITVWRNRQWRVWFLITTSVVAYVLALGDQTLIYGWVRRVFPPLGSITFPVKFVIIITFALPLLAGMAVASLPTRPKKASETRTLKLWAIERQLLLTAAVLLLLIVFIVTWARVAPLDDFAATLCNGVSRAIFLALVSVLFVSIGRSTSARQYRVLSLAMLLLIWLDVWTHEPQQNPTAPAAIYQPGLVRKELAMNPQPSLGQTRVMVSPWANDLLEQQHLKVTEVKDSYLAARLGYYGDCNLLDEVPKVNGFFALYPYQCDQLTQLLYLSTNTSFPRLADFLCVSHVTAPGEGTVWERRHTYLPAITAGQKPVFLDDTNTMRRLIRSDFDGTKTVFLPEEAKGLVSVSTQTDAHVLSQRFGREEVEAEVDASAPAMLTISQTYYHCWHAYVDNRPVPLWRANFAFQAVQTPAGKHHIRLAYEERGFRIGAVVSMLTALGCVFGNPAFWQLVVRKLRSGKFGCLTA